MAPRAPASRSDAGAPLRSRAGRPTRRAPLARIALAAVAWGPAALAAQIAPAALAAPAAAARPEAWPAPPALDVPFVPQGELLCGGAAAAMVLRHHGQRGASAEAFAHLVRRDEGGIRTDELAGELERLGWRTESAAGDPAALARALAAGVPPIVLLESSAGRWHYVVVVAMDADGVRVHDPAKGPDQRLDEAAFLARWDAGRRWMLLVHPPAPAAARGAAGAAADEPAPSPELLGASERFRARDWSASAAAAERATRAAPGDLRAWRLLGGALYLAGRPDDALDAWAKAGEPRLDGLRVTGLARTRHPVVHALIGLEPGAPLTRADLERGRRRLALLPGAALTRVAYRALPGGWAEAEAVAIEGAAHPFTRPGMVEAAFAAAGGELTAWESGLAGAGERIEARWRPDTGAAGLQLAVPGGLGLGGRVEVGAVRRADASDGAWLRATDWAASWLRWEAGARADRWVGSGLRGGLAGALHAAAPGDLVAVRVGAAVWPGDAGRRLTVLAVDAGLALGGAADRWSAGARGGIRALRGNAPEDLLPAAGASGARALGGPFAGPDPLPLLRADSLVRGSRVVHAGLEGTRWAGGAFRVGIAAFVDGASVRAAAGWDRRVDAGLGLRLTLPGLDGALRLDHAWALAGGAHRWSAGWSFSPTAALSP